MGPPKWIDHDRSTKPGFTIPRGSPSNFEDFEGRLLRPQPCRLSMGERPWACSVDVRRPLSAEEIACEPRFIAGKWIRSSLKYQNS